MNKQGQSSLEYVVLISIVAMALIAMIPAIKRGSHSLIKITADQIGNQAEADQDSNRRTMLNGEPLLAENGEPDDPILKESFSNAYTKGNVVKKERRGTRTALSEEVTKTYSNFVTDMGFKEQ